MELLLVIFQHRDRTENTFADRRATHCLRHRQDVALDLGREAKQPKNFGHLSPGEALAAGEGRLIGHRTGREQRPPLDRPCAVAQPPRVSWAPAACYARAGWR